MAVVISTTIVVRVAKQTICMVVFVIFDLIAIFELPADEDQALLIRRSVLLVLGLSLHVRLRYYTA